MVTLTQKFGQYVAKKRRQKGISQTELSRRLFNSENQSYISNIESGKNENINMNTAGKILDILDSDIQFIDRV